MHNITSFFTIALLLVSATAFAGFRTATIERSATMREIGNSAAYNQSSFFEIYTALVQLRHIKGLETSDIIELTGIKSTQEIAVEMAIDRWISTTSTILLANITKACNGFVQTQSQVEQQVEHQTNIQECPTAKNLEGALTDYKNIYTRIRHQQTTLIAASVKFHYDYLLEQLRLAMLFGTTSSEVFKYTHSEINGFEMADGDFLLTFDDGPKISGTTQRVIDKLHHIKKRAAFFVTGTKLDSLHTDSAVALYQHHCLYSHGYTHKNHTRLSNWKESFKATDISIANIQKRDNHFVRPPYGQRNLVIINFVETELHSKIMLWNIDSQDWQSSMSAKMISDRVITLMLLWRRGIVLFHDTNTKSLNFLERVPEIESTKAVKFLHCDQAYDLFG